jgi:hypothetical protein
VLVSVCRECHTRLKGVPVENGVGWHCAAGAAPPSNHHPHQAPELKQPLPCMRFGTGTPNHTLPPMEQLRGREGRWRRAAADRPRPRSVAIDSAGPPTAASPLRSPTHQPAATYSETPGAAPVRCPWPAPTQVFLTASPSPSLSPHCVSLTVSPSLCLSHRLPHCVSPTVSLTVSPSLCLSHRLPHGFSHRVSLTVSPS